MRIGFACLADTANGHYRVLVPLTELARRGHAVIGPGDASYRAAVTGTPNWDLMLVHQSASEENLETVRRLRGAGVAIVWDSDDDIGSIPHTRGTRRTVGGPRKLKRYHELSLEMARSAHLVTTTNEQLANLFRDTGAEQVAVLPNCL